MSFSTYDRMKRFFLLGFILNISLVDKVVAQKITFDKAISMLQVSNNSLDSSLRANGWKVTHKWGDIVTYGNKESVQKSTKFVIVRFSRLRAEYNEIEVLFRSSKKFKKFAIPSKLQILI